MTTRARPPRSRSSVRSLPGLAGALVRQWWPQVAALAAASGVVAATIVGAIGVGDGLRQGLRGLALARLGGIEAAVLADDWFGAGLVDALEDESAPGRLVPAIVTEVAVDAGAGRATSRATLLGCDDPAGLGFVPAPPPLAADAVLLNGPLASALAAGPGDAIVMRVPRRSNVPADSPLGRRTAASNGRRLRVEAVLPAAGLGQFALRPAQVTGPLIVTSLEVARAILGQPDATNTAFAVASPAGAAGPDPAGAGAATANRLGRRLRPRLADYGLALDPATDASAAVRLTSRRLLLPAEVDRAAEEVLRPLGGRPSLAFLATALTPLDASGTASRATIPYSTVLGIESTSLPVGDLVDDEGRPLPSPGPDEILVDRWMAADLAAQGRPVTVGDRLELRFFQPETLHGRVEETTATLRIAGIAAMRGAAVARELVPDVEGVTDEKSIADWDPPFPFEPARVRTTPPDDQDDRYWSDYGPTPKAFVSLATARRLAGSRFGNTTAWHLPRTVEAGAVGERLAAALRPEALGLRVVPLRADAVAAARGSTPFGGLFLALSSFVVAAGLVLEWLLFRLLVAARRREVGILAAIGWSPARLTRLLLAVGGLAAVAGTVVGAAIGPLWTRALLAALGRSWNRAVSEGSAPVFIAAAPAWSAVWPGAVAALAVSLAALLWAARHAASLPPLELIRGLDASGRIDRLGRRPGLLVGVCLLGVLLAAAAAAAGRGAGGQVAVGLFFAAGFAALVGLLAAVRLWLGTGRSSRVIRSLPGLARRSLAHQASRAFAVAATVALAQFLIVAVSGFALRPPDDPADRRSPTGGWTTIATFGEPTSVDPTDAATRATLGLSTAQEQALAGCTIARLRSSGGDDASCVNLYAAGRPAVLGVGPTFIERGGFSFVAHAKSDAAGPAGANPWTLLADAVATPADRPIPAILDQATAQWALKLGGVGARFTLPDEAGRPVALVIAGLLEPGILQGFVIVGEADFVRIYPSRSGYGMALVDASGVAGDRRPVVRDALATAWADAGVSQAAAVDRLRSLQAVQNTFLGAFQALGTLGLLLGTAGVAAVQLQGVAERIGLLGLLRAIGFSVARVRALLVLETLLTVGAGLLAGTAAGCLAVAPSFAAESARIPVAWIAATGGLTLAAALLAGWLAATRTTIPERPAA